MLIKYTLYTAMALSMSLQSALAVINLEEPDPVLVAQESIQSSDYLAGQLQVSTVGTELNIVTISGFSLFTDHKYARFELSNAVLGTALPATGLDLSASYDSILEVGGAQGDNYAIISVSSTTLQPRTTPLTLPLTALQVIDDSKPVTLHYTLYDNASEAIYGGVELYSNTAEILRVVPALGEFFTDSYTASADFSQNFLRFKPSFRSPSVYQLGDTTAELASLGQFLADRLVVDNARFAHDLSLVTDFRDLIPAVNPSNPTASIKGDIATSEVYLHSAVDCTSGTSFSLQEDDENYDDSRFYLSLDQLVLTPYLCANATSDVTQISRTTYYLDLGIGIRPQILGEINYDAATADLPFITTFSQYRQRLIFTNYTNQDISYLVEVNAEDGATEGITLLPGSSGVIAPGASLKLNSTDIVEIAQGLPTRVSGRVYFNGDINDVSAAVQILSIGSTEPPVTNVLTIKAL